MSETHETGWEVSVNGRRASVLVVRENDEEYPRIKVAVLPDTHVSGREDER